MPSLFFLFHKNLHKRFLVALAATFAFIIAGALLIHGTTSSFFISNHTPNIPPLSPTNLAAQVHAQADHDFPDQFPNELQLDDGSAGVVVAQEDAEILEAHKLKNDQIRAQLLDNLPKCATQGQAKSFFLVFMGHSGSTAMMTSLKQHSQTYIEGYEPVDHGIYVANPKMNSSLKALHYSYNFFRNASELKKTAGFKIRPRNLRIRPKGFAELVRMFDTRLIWSYRTNVMKQAVGTYTTKYLNDNSAFEGLLIDDSGNVKDTNRSTHFKIHNMSALHDILKSRIRGDLEVAAALQMISPDNCVLPISYESFLQQPEISIQRVQQFLGLNTTEIHPPLRAKATKDSLCDVVDNWSEVCEAFFGCFQWRWMLDDFENGCTCSDITPSTFNLTRKYCSMS